MEAVRNALEVVKYPAPVLRKKAARVNRVTPEIAAFIERMYDTMYAANGVGLAAPQVGISLRIVVIDVGDGPFAMLNPVIESREGTQTGIEGCLSLPNLHGEVSCAQKVTVSCLNARGKKVVLQGEDLKARCMQHEIDHLDGVLFIDHVLPGTLSWVTGEEDADGHLIEKATTLEDALRAFEREAALR